MSCSSTASTKLITILIWIGQGIFPKLFTSTAEGTTSRFYSTVRLPTPIYAQFPQGPRPPLQVPNLMVPAGRAPAFLAGHVPGPIRSTMPDTTEDIAL